MKRLMVVALLVALLTVSALASSGNAAGTFNCNGINSGLISGSVNVPNGDLCSLDGANVTGSVTVQAGGGLVIIHGSTIRGSVVQRVDLDLRQHREGFGDRRQREQSADHRGARLGSLQ
jgi:hypothetical protein